MEDELYYPHHLTGHRRQATVLTAVECKATAGGVVDRGRTFGRVLGYVGIARVDHHHQTILYFGYGVLD